MHYAPYCTLWHTIVEQALPRTARHALQDSIARTLTKQIEVSMATSMLQGRLNQGNIHAASIARQHCSLTTTVAK